MPREFVISDLHFGHGLMISEKIRSPRPYDDTTEMNNALVEAWNAVVRPEDTVYVLGDVVLGMNPDAGIAQLSRLLGRKVLVRGNHDQDEIVTAPGLWDEVHSYLELPRTKDRPMVVLFHFPIEEWHGIRRDAVHLHGHQHGRNRPMKNRLDVGVDAVGLAPIRLEDAIKLAQKQKTVMTALDVHSPRSKR